MCFSRRAKVCEAFLFFDRGRWVAGRAVLVRSGLGEGRGSVSIVHENSKARTIRTRNLADRGGHIEVSRYRASHSRENRAAATHMPQQSGDPRRTRSFHMRMTRISSAAAFSALILAMAREVARSPRRDVFSPSTGSTRPSRRVPIAPRCRRAKSASSPAPSP